MSMQEVFQEGPVTEGPRDSVRVSLSGSVLSYVTACVCGHWVSWGVKLMLCIPVGITVSVVFLLRQCYSPQWF